MLDMIKIYSMNMVIIFENILLNNNINMIESIAKNEKNINGMFYVSYCICDGWM